MRLQHGVAGAAIAVTARGATLDSVCTTANVQASLPANNTILGLAPILSSVTASPIYNYSSKAGGFFPASTFNYCNVTVAYTHFGRNDVVHLQYWMPSPDAYKNRFLATGGGGFAINSGTMSLPGGVMYGAVSGITDGGFGSFSTNMDAVFLLANGTINYQTLYMFGYNGIAEMTKMGKALSKAFYGKNGTDSKLYTYYQGCSEGGREGWSQVQRFPQEYDGVIPGAPAFRFAQQQVQHSYSNVVEQTLNYFPGSCELAKIVNETIAFCDPLDGKTDGVVARSDLCQLQVNLDSMVGKPYSCAATTGSSGPPGRKRQFPMAGPTPAQNGTVSAEAIAVCKKIAEGLHDSKGRRAYISYQPGATFGDAGTTFNTVTGKFELSINSMGGEYIAKFLQLLNIDNLPNLNNVTYDTLVDYMQQGWTMYEDSLQTTLLDLTPYQAKGGKVLHFHGESDNSIPAGSSVHYHESVRKIMYPDMSFNESSAALSSWYKLFLIPGAAHCGTNNLQPNGPFPQSNLQTMIDWVENGVEPKTLNGTVLQGANIGQQQDICAWPLRPMWSSNTTSPNCVYDQTSIDSWMYTFDAFKQPLY